MNKKLILSLALLFCLLALPLQATGLAAPQAPGGEVANVVVTADGVTWQPLVESSGWTLRIAGPQGVVFEQTFAASEQPVFAFKSAGSLPDGVYSYELWGSPLVSEDEAPADPLYMSGVFTMLDGAASLPDPAATEKPQTAGPYAPQSPNDQVITDDLIVTHNTCTGESCYSNMPWIFSPLTLSGAQLRIMFDDTSTGSYATNDWAILINDTASGGTDYFAIMDQDSGRIPFRIRADALTDSLYIDSTGYVGIGTSTPAAKLHVVGDLRVDGFVNERSDVAAKTAFAAVDGQEVLQALAAVPITTWSYKDTPSVRHMGPMAQDFRAAYGLGPDEKHIAALDVNGVALAAIQALDAQSKEKDARIADLTGRVQSLEAQLASRQALSLWSQLAPLALGLLGLFIGARIARKR